MAIFYKDKEILDIFSGTVKDIITSITEQNKEMFKAMKDMQVEHFKQLEKTSAKQLGLLEKQNKEFLKHLENMNTPKEIPFKDEPQPFDYSRIAQESNPIEEKTEEEIPLGEMPRIPIVEGINVRFEDREESFPINIESSDKL